MNANIKTFFIAAGALVVLFVVALSAQNAIPSGSAYWKPIAKPVSPNYSDILNPVLIGDFSIDIVPSDQTVPPDIGVVEYMVTLTSFNGFTGPVALTSDLMHNPEITNYWFDEQILQGASVSTMLHIGIRSAAPEMIIPFAVYGTGTPGDRSDTAMLRIVRF